MKKLILSVCLMSLTIFSFGQTASPLVIQDSGTPTTSMDLSVTGSIFNGNNNNDLSIQTSGATGRTQVNILPKGTQAAFMNLFNGPSTTDDSYARLGVRGEYAVLSFNNGANPAVELKNFAIELDPTGTGVSGEVFQVGTGGFFSQTNPTILFHVQEDGKVGIGTDKPSMLFTVNGDANAKELKVEANVEAPDYVFKEDYQLRSLDEVEAFINKNSHLPEIPSAAEFKEDGIYLSRMSFDLLKKVEELTLYIIDLKKEQKLLKDSIQRLESQK